MSPSFLLQYSFVQMNTQIIYSYLRFDFLIVLSTIGSILYTLKTLSGKVVSAVTDYSLDKSMMLKLYTIDKYLFNVKSETAKDDESTKSGKQILLENLKERENFYYSPFHCLKKFCCCCCGSCMPERTIEDKLY